jgi:hypothetical protein
MMTKILDIDKYCPYDDAQIFEQYNVKLIRALHSEVGYHILQIITTKTLNENGEKYIVWNRCGVYHNQDYVDYRTQIYQDVFDNPFEAVDRFMNVFKNKTKTDYFDPSPKIKPGNYTRLV